jgi:sortase B
MKATKILLFVSIIVFIYSSYNLISYFYDSYNNNKMYKGLGELFYTEEYEKSNDTNISGDASNNENIRKDETAKDEKRVLQRFLPLLEINPEIVGWISISGTNIDYPVVQTDNNEYYLSYDFRGNKARQGTIFMDYRNSPDCSDKNTIIYGHNMRDGSMFGVLARFKDKNFFQENTTILFYTLYEITEWEIFSAYVTDTSFNYIKQNFTSDEEYLNFINAIKDKSMHKRNVELRKDDKIITLSTCSYEFNNARFVVHARRVR